MQTCGIQRSAFRSGGSTRVRCRSVDSGETLVSRAVRVSRRVLRRRQFVIVKRRLLHAFADIHKDEFSLPVTQITAIPEVRIILGPVRHYRTLSIQLFACAGLATSIHNSNETNIVTSTGAAVRREREPCMRLRSKVHTPVGGRRAVSETLRQQRPHVFSHAPGVPCIIFNARMLPCGVSAVAATRDETGTDLVVSIAIRCPDDLHEGPENSCFRACRRRL